MLTRSGDKFRLDIFLNFLIDENLPKHKKKPRRDEESKDSNVLMESGRRNFSTGLSWVTTNAPQIVSNTGSVPAPSLWERIMGHFGYVRGERIEAHKPKEEPKPPEKQVELVFDCVVKNDEQIKDIGAKIDKFKAMIEQAHALGQEALVEELTSTWQIYCYEAQLVANQLARVISEERLIEFVSGCEKGLRLDWIKNFTRMIPFDLGKKKIDIDTLEVFDNYVVLHYDPDNKNNSFTKDEMEKIIAKKRDPILFGVIDGSFKLYYIGDWKDEYCDLTWEDIAEKIDAKHLVLE